MTNCPQIRILIILGEVKTLARESQKRNLTVPTNRFPFPPSTNPGKRQKFLQRLHRSSICRPGEPLYHKFEPAAASD
jgi:hypothetical protein